MKIKLVGMKSRDIPSMNLKIGLGETIDVSNEVGAKLLAHNTEKAVIWECVADKKKLDKKDKE